MPNEKSHGAWSLVIGESDGTIRKQTVRDFGLGKEACRFSDVNKREDERLEAAHMNAERTKGPSKANNQFFFQSKFRLV